MRQEHVALCVCTCICACVWTLFGIFNIFTELRQLGVFFLSKFILMYLFFILFIRSKLSIGLRFRKQYKHVIKMVSIKLKFSEAAEFV